MSTHSETILREAMALGETERREIAVAHSVPPVRNSAYLARRKVPLLTAIVNGAEKGSGVFFFEI